MWELFLNVDFSSVTTIVLAELEHLRGHKTNLNIKYSSQFTVTSFKWLHLHCFLTFWRPRRRTCRVVDLKVAIWIYRLYTPRPRYITLTYLSKYIDNWCFSYRQSQLNVIIFTPAWYLSDTYLWPYAVAWLPGTKSWENTRRDHQASSSKFSSFLSRWDMR